MLIGAAHVLAQPQEDTLCPEHGNKRRFVFILMRIFAVGTGAIGQVINQLEGLAEIHHPSLVSNKALLTGPLSGKYLSAEHARVVGRTQAPTIDAWVGKRVLTAIADAQDAPNHPAAPKLKF